MEIKNWYVIGIMSGTSLDGVDLAYVKISRNSGYDFELLQTESLEYSELWKNKLQGAFTISGEKLTELDAEYGIFLADQVRKFIAKRNIKKVDFLASHGHTIFHDPQKNYTLQIGSGAHLAARSGYKVICDFRVQDVALGGQGAPLVPIGDKLLFGTYDFCLNIGGFANISFDLGSERIAYDICPANIVLNHYTRSRGLDYDDKGQVASQGQINKGLLDELNNLEFYLQQRPKSLGYEFVEEMILPIIENYGLSFKDILRTYNEHIALQIANEIDSKSKILNKDNSTVLITGGGAYNDFMIRRISELSKAEIKLPSNQLIEFKEALIFALLGVLKEQEEINCLKSVTGACMDHSSGVVYGSKLK
ncbi:anhydro-N-acetylmuramic acid kinase [Lutimonas zeaxanthinifaciens]|uniref:anhydro-N-acetylmuramic acid kinase n=1 Tax=Lutimonas zeaxanthinifaciens TaxID=3060215 RepID=UPI00265D32BB|nr:anhydro-N-acetylmuramic acid kinase [Lutimonas sp. YSD2104]WKK65380.1 anhydro-N-acetylmuramic acid kinase [Lutimonas sp. YSD2104]